MEFVFTRWLLEFLATLTGTSMTLLALGFLSKNAIIERLKNSVKHEFDKKLLIAKEKYDEKLSELNSRLSQQNSLISIMSEKNLSTYQLFVNKQIESIDMLWCEMESLRKLIPGELHILDQTPAEYHELLIGQSTFKKGFDIEALNRISTFLKTSKSVQARLYSGELLYSYFSLYTNIVVISVSASSTDRLNGKFMHWHEKYDLDKLFSTGSSFGFNAVNKALGKTAEMLSMIQKKFLEDAQNVLTGKEHLNGGIERVKVIQELITSTNTTKQL